MLTAYFDESESGKKLCVVGGFVSTSEKWLKFSEECEGLKSEFNIPYFHSVELFSLKSTRLYGHLSATRRLDLVYALRDAIVKWTEYSLTATVIPRTYNALTTPEWRNCNKTYYAACFYWILLGLEDLYNEKTVTLFYEDGHRHAGEVENLLRDYKLVSDDDPEELIVRPYPLLLKLGGYGRLTKELATPLWAADLISYCFTRQVVHRDPLCHELANAIDAKIPSFGYCIDEEKIGLMMSLAADVEEQVKQFGIEAHKMTKDLSQFGIKAVKYKQGVGFDFEFMTPEQKEKFEDATNGKMADFEDL